MAESKERNPKAAEPATPATKEPGQPATPAEPATPAGKVVDGWPGRVPEPAPEPVDG